MMQLSGKSINVIRSFPGIGTLVFGGRTLEIVRTGVTLTEALIRTIIKTCNTRILFEPNGANTWVKVKSMMINFLTNLWKQGAAGSAPEQAFDVQLGIGSMTPTDILNGKMLITVKVAIGVRLNSS
jgi:phage tail sheath protein FI